MSTTAIARTSTTPTAGPGVSGRRGPRAHHADATASHAGHRTGRLAVAVADGVGDSGAAAFAARLAADHAVRVAVLEGRADLGVLAAHDLLASTGDLVTGDAAMVVALGPAPGRREWTLAWVGDCRAYALHGTLLSLRTADHTVAAEMRAAGIAVHPRFDHVLATSVRTVRPTEIGTARVDRPDALLLVSDGVHRAVDAAMLVHALTRPGTAQDRAERITGLAARAGTRDNATALVVTTTS